MKNGNVAPSSGKVRERGEQNLTRETQMIYALAHSFGTNGDQDL